MKWLSEKIRSKFSALETINVNLPLLVDADVVRNTDMAELSR